MIFSFQCAILIATAGRSTAVARQNLDRCGWFHICNLATLAQCGLRDMKIYANCKSCCPRKGIRVSVYEKYADVAVLTPCDVMQLMQWSKAHTYKVLEEVAKDGKPYAVKKICGTLRINKTEFFSYLISEGLLNAA